jgi:periplasmic divalent cation tolerance protein
VTDKIVVLSTCESEEQAAQVARHLVEHRLAACVNILPGARSIYRWKGAIEEAGELLLVIKSRRDLFAAIRTAIQKIPFLRRCPKVIAIPVVDGSEATWRGSIVS